MSEGEAICEDCGHFKLVDMGDPKLDEVVCEEGYVERGTWLRRQVRADGKIDWRPRERFVKPHECAGFVPRKLAQRGVRA
jgi:hypothetical protein